MKYNLICKTVENKWNRIKLFKYFTLVQENNFIILLSEKRRKQLIEINNISFNTLPSKDHLLGWKIANIK